MISHLFPPFPSPPPSDIAFLFPPPPPSRRRYWGGEEGGRNYVKRRVDKGGGGRRREGGGHFWRPTLLSLRVVGDASSSSSSSWAHWCRREVDREKTGHNLVEKRRLFPNFRPSEKTYYFQGYGRRSKNVFGLPVSFHKSNVEILNKKNLRVKCAVAIFFPL